MTAEEELAQLEAERDRLLSMIAYHNRRFFQVPVGRAPAWFIGVAIVIICGIGVSIVAGAFAGQVSTSAILFPIFLVVGLLALAYISTRKITIFGTILLVGDILSLFGGVATPVGRPAGEPEAHQRLADCEARIIKLKEGRP
jgi:hypothetical protein